MVDSFNPQEPAVIAPEAADAAAPKTGLSGFLSSTLGKLVLGGVALSVLLGVVATVLVLFVFAAGDTDLTITPAPGSIVTTATVGSAEESPTPSASRAVQDTFAFRNIMQPTVKPIVVASQDTSPSSDATGAAGPSGEQLGINPSDVPEDTLYLYGVSSVNGSDVGTFIWNGTVYNAAAGEELEGTPWKVIRLSGNTALMQYGDAQMSFTVGQGFTK